MAIVRFDPMRGFETLTRRMNNLVGEFEKGWNVEFGNFSPRIDISEDEKHIYLQAEIPGIAKEEIKLTINDDNVLIIKGEKKREVKTEQKDEAFSFIRMERSFGEFSRSFILPENVKKDSVSAKFENGILGVTLEKIEPEKPKEIEVSIA